MKSLACTHYAAPPTGSHSDFMTDLCTHLRFSCRRDIMPPVPSPTDVRATSVIVSSTNTERPSYFPLSVHKPFACVLVKQRSSQREANVRGEGRFPMVYPTRFDDVTTLSPLTSSNLGQWCSWHVISPSNGYCQGVFGTMFGLLPCELYPPSCPKNHLSRSTFHRLMC